MTKVRAGVLTPTPNTGGLRAHAQRKSEVARHRVLAALEHLRDEQATVNFNTVAKAAGVTKSYLYATSDLRKKIEDLRQGQAQVRLVLVTSGDMDRKKTDKSKDVLLEAKDRRIKALEVEVTRLTEENKRLHGKLYEKI